MSKKEYVLYAGEKFIVEWYFTAEGKSQPFDYFNSLDAQQHVKNCHAHKKRKQKNAERITKLA